ncbi:MAG: cupin domain-containing protein [Inquilinus sp.]|nr:cupin domain-containing protein [Inquilinus sp.]
MDWLQRLADTTKALPAAPGRPWREVMRHGSMYAGLYAPRGVDDQNPHEKDELYVVVAGRARFRRAEETRDVTIGDMLFVPAGMEHRFEAMSDDFAVWAVFWGAPGGEG